MDLRERWQINHQLISVNEFFELAQKIVDLENKYININHRVTVFEFFTLIAVLYFYNQNVDFILWETGLGGRLDATNIVIPIISLITCIGFDHQDILGSSLEKIAYEKAGIIKENIPFITTEEKSHILKLLRQYAAEKSSEYFEFKRDFTFCKFPKQKIEFSMGDINLQITNPMLGDFQHKNLSLALACLCILKEKKYISTLPNIQAIEKAHWPGRLESLENGLLVDCMHNIDGAKNLLQFLDCTKKYHFIISFLKDKNWQGIIDLLLSYAQSFTVYQMQVERALETEELISYINTKSNVLVHSIFHIREFEELSYYLEESIVCGSIILVGHVLEYFS